jgi:glycosyltransferase involved in cell wall biosynthesis
MTADTFGGVWTHAAELTDQLALRGHDVLLAALGRAPTADQLRMLGAVDLVTWQGALEWMPDPWDDVQDACEWLLDVHDEFRPEIVHLNSYAYAALEFPSPVVVGAHSCVLSWFAAVRGETAPHGWTRYRLNVGRGLRAADAVVAPTRTMLAALRRHYSFASPCFVIPNGRRTPSPGAKRPLVVAAGRMWDEAKNIAAVERAARRISWPVRIAGEGTNAGRIEQSDLDRWLSQASIFVSPALYEPFGLTALEAAGAGCALVLGDLDSLREVWEDAALYVDPRDDDELAGAVQRLIDDDATRERLATAARRRAQRFSPERMANDFCALYARLALQVAQPEPA